MRKDLLGSTDQFRELNFRVPISCPICISPMTHNKELTLQLSLFLFLF